jgi:nickel-dependent lactate racemase
MATGRGAVDRRLSETDIRAIVERGVPAHLVHGKRVLVLTPDATRSCPLPLMSRIVARVVGARAKRLDFMIALGTHQALTEEKIDALFGLGPGDRDGVFRGMRFLNHRWDLPDSLRKLGSIRESEIEELTRGLFRESVDVVINRAVDEYDLVLVLGPVFPHEVVGFSGGNKYLFPGISGGDFVHFFHWLGAVITCMDTIGIKHTPPRALVDRAASMLSVPRWCLAMVVAPDGALAGLYAGTPEEAWSSAADLSERLHVLYKPSPFTTVLGQAPEMYDEIWTAGKVMYKLEPIVADGGTLIIYAPHVKEISHTWGRYLMDIGYHVRDWFLKRMDAFRDVPRGVLAHSTHVRGVGTWENGVETPRIDVVLATAIPRDVCGKINLGYMDPAAIDLQSYKGREAQGVLYVEHAGEILHRLAVRPAPGGRPGPGRPSGA